ncbi:hypothetical protein AXG93_702s1140 [Marchantia polymorpha subsp. ruderalis]|uniref:Uncharacterized protein n=1 Tax=Marchantia polymorpha subsp. ruderalis TaxID=1480154 RepID=A0A176WAE9_MARPO|nr:hypothetical protein AXG93_702s1140 [Marchantia polymorpha subsp. ruderalis]
MSKNNIVGRAQTGKLMVSQERQDHLEKEIAHHLGLVGREFQCGSINEDMVVNWDETHFVINMDNGKMLGFRGDNDVKYANDDEWTWQRELYKFEQIKSGEGFKNTYRKDGKSSSALKNLGKTWFLKLAASSVRAVNLMRDRNGVSYARKAMIWCGLSLDINGQWHSGQRSTELQEIIK